MRIKTARWNSAISKKEWRERGRNTLVVGEQGTNPDPDPPPPVDPDPPVGRKLFAGHVPNRVLVGMAASGSQRPTEDEALSILGGVIYERRIFTQSNPSTAALNNMLAECDSMNAYPVTSFKIGDWAGVAAGNFDSQLNLIRNIAIQRRTAGPGGTPMPFACGIHHEPDGDGVLSEWADMQIYCSNYFAGIKNGQYTAANDVTDIMAWQAIANGHWWGPKNRDNTKINAGFPASLVTVFRQNKSLLLADFYDPNPPGDNAANPYPANADRTSKKIQSFIDWARSNNCGAIGCGEFSTTTSDELQRSWKVMRDNRDIWVVSNYFNSFANSRWDWRLIPNGYPAYNGTNSKGLTDIGGTTLTEAQLLAFRVMRNESVSAQYTSPIGGGP